MHSLRDCNDRDDLSSRLYRVAKIGVTLPPLPAYKRSLALLHAPKQWLRARGQQPERQSPIVMRTLRSLLHIACLCEVVCSHIPLSVFLHASCSSFFCVVVASLQPLRRRRRHRRRRCFDVHSLSSSLCLRSWWAVLRVTVSVRCLLVLNFEPAPNSFIAVFKYHQYNCSTESTLRFGLTAGIV